MKGESCHVDQVAFQVSFFNIMSDYTDVMSNLFNRPFYQYGSHSIVSNSYYGMLREQIYTNLPIPYILI